MKKTNFVSVMYKSLKHNSFLILLLVVGFHFFGINTLAHSAAPSIEMIPTGNVITITSVATHELHEVSSSAVVNLIAEISEENIEEETQEKKLPTSSRPFSYYQKLLSEILFPDSEVTKHCYDETQLLDSAPLFIRYEVFRL